MNYYSNGKLLITGEYAVLDGALALAVPTTFKQSLEVTPVEEKKIYWKSLDEKGNLWLEAFFEINGGKLISSEKSSANDLQNKLQKILHTAAEMNPEIISEAGYRVETKLDFPQDWGLGSSSTLINNIAQWFDIDAYSLLEKTFGGSGYDIAAAQNNRPITYQLHGKNRSVLTVDFDPLFQDQLFFVHLQQKQNSRDSIAHYRKQPSGQLLEATEKVSALTTSFLQCDNLLEFNLLVEIHETLISKLINTPKIKSTLFPDYPGAIKSLGGWGGDFILATGGKAEQDYFRKKGYTTVVTYEKMVKQ